MANGRRRTRLTPPGQRKFSSSRKASRSMSTGRFRYLRVDSSYRPLRKGVCCGRAATCRKGREGRSDVVEKKRKSKNNQKGVCANSEELSEKKADNQCKNTCPTLPRASSCADCHDGEAAGSLNHEKKQRGRAATHDHHEGQSRCGYEFSLAQKVAALRFCFARGEERKERRSWVGSL